MHETFKHLPVGQNLFALIDAEDWEEVNRHKWYASSRIRAGAVRYYVSRKIRESGRAKALFLHRALTNAATGQVVDHINGDPLDNRRSNLRLCNHSQNNANRKNFRPGKFRGVYEKPTGHFGAMICVSRKMLWLGTFADPASAAKAYDEAAKTHFGSFARLNFPGGESP